MAVSVKTNNDGPEQDTRQSPVRVAVVQFDPQVGIENLLSNAAAVQERLARI
jgi:N-carbamoylputrescine amidase